MPDGSRDIRHETQVRTMTLERLATSEGKAAVYRASLSSELPVERWFGTEILSHADGAVDMARAARGLSLLFNHDMDKVLGRVELIRLDNGRLVGDLRFAASDPDGARYERLVAEGMLSDVSIRYSIEEYETKTDEHGHDTVTITRWTPLEASIVTVPADHTVGVGRGREEAHPNNGRKAIMSDDVKPEAGQDGGGTSTVAAITGRRAKDMQRGAIDALKRNQERVETIQELFAGCRWQNTEFQELRDRCVADHKISPDMARALMLDLINQLPEAAAEPTATRKAPDERPNPARDPLVTVQRTAEDKLIEGIQRSIEARAGMLSKEDLAKEATSEFRGLHMAELARAYAMGVQLRIAGLNRHQMLGMVLAHGKRSGYLGTADFTGILANVANKAMLMGWEEAQATYRQVAKIGSTPDFKRANRTGLSGASLLDKVPENVEFQYGKRVDRTEYLTPATYGKLFSISRQALMNDDLAAFTTIPRSMGRAAERTVNKVFWDYVVQAAGVGPTLNQDNTALFEASTHKNYDASSGGITVTNVDTGRQKMRRQLDPVNSQPLNIAPAILLVPAALETTANVFVASETDPDGRSGAAGAAKQPNPFHNKLTVVCEPTLDDATNGTTAWYLLANPNQFDTFEVAFVDGQQTPYMEERDGWSVDGVEYKVRIDAGVAALDYRGVYRKKGA